MAVLSCPFQRPVQLCCFA